MFGPLTAIAGAGGFTGGAATSGPATQGNQGVNIGGIQTGGSSGIPPWVIAAGVGAVALTVLAVLRRR